MADNEHFAKVFEVLQANQEKDFVKRILDPRNSPFIENEDGSITTHKMATAEADGAHYVFPTVMRDEEGELRSYHSDDDKWAAFKEAIKRGEAIKFESKKDADWFERNWKTVWGHPARK
jgi:hypothetical protein